MNPVRRTLLLSHTGGVASLAGLQAAIPALPLVQEALDLSDSQTALVVSAYLLPSVIFAVPAGFLADRLGRRRLFVGAFALFGLAGAATLLADSFAALLLIRMVQGAAFAAVLPLSITMLGDAVSGATQVRQQGLRAVLIAGGDMVWPLVGGALAVLSWAAPFASSVVAIPLALLGWRWLDAAPARMPKPVTVRQLGATLRTRIGLAVQAAGFLRFLFKFALFVMAPLLLHQRGYSTFFISAVLAASAAAAMAAAALSPVSLRWFRASALLRGGLVVFAAAFFVVPSVDVPAAVVAAFVAFGVAEGLFSVLSNSMLLESVDDAERATFVSVAGAIKNSGKFLAPTVLSLLVLAMSLETAFLTVGVAALTATVTMLPLRSLDDGLRTARTAPSPEPDSAAGTEEAARPRSG
jgi:ACDE family multidrug resistance protein